MVRAIRTLVTVATLIPLPASVLAATATSPPLTPNSADIAWRYVLEKTAPADGCPSAGVAWKQQPLFAADIVDPFMHKGLQTFCLYQHTGGTILDADLAALLAALGPFGTVEPDRMVLGLAGDSLGSIVWPALAHRFAIQAGFAALPPPSAEGKVRLSVLDTSPTLADGGSSAYANSKHGYTLLNMAEKMLCNDTADCRAQISSRLALPWVEFDAADATLSGRDDVYGGYVGSMLDLAHAIRGAVAGTASVDAVPESHLVINLSVAWHPIFGGLETATGDMPVAARAVLQAVEDAVCNGALVIAAAGNITNGPNAQSGPMLPAAWEQRAAPTAEECKRLRLGDDDGRPDCDYPDCGRPKGDPSGDPIGATTGAATEPPEPASYRPLVYAVGGMRDSGGPLPNARPHSRPPLVAFGDHGVVEGHLPGQPTATLTGTSVAAIVTSATATAVWAYRPDLDAGSVMDLVYQYADSLIPANQPDFCLGGACYAQRPEVRRVSVCEAVQHVCAETPSACLGAAPQCPRWPAPPGQLSYDFTAFDQAATHFDAGEVNLEYGNDPVCGAVMLFRHPGLPGDPEHPCPSRQFHGVDTVPWVHPQPGTHACPNCSLTNGPDGGVGGITSGGGLLKSGPSPDIATLRIAIDSDFKGTLSDPTLTTALGIFSLSGSGLCLVQGNTCVLTNVPYPGFGPVTLTYKVTDGNDVRSATSPAVILP